MKNEVYSSKSGFISTIIIIIVGLILLKVWFDFDIIEFLKSAKVVEWTAYIRNVFVFIWEHYLSGAFNAVWNLILNLIDRAKA